MTPGRAFRLAFLATIAVLAVLTLGLRLLPAPPPPPPKAPARVPTPAPVELTQVALDHLAGQQHERQGRDHRHQCPAKNAQQQELLLAVARHGTKAPGGGKHRFFQKSAQGLHEALHLPGSPVPGRVWVFRQRFMLCIVSWRPEAPFA